MTENPNSELFQAIIKLWQEKNYDEASQLILQAKKLELSKLVQSINFDLLNPSAFIYVLQHLSLDELQDNLSLYKWDLHSEDSQNIRQFTQEEQEATLRIVIRKYQEKFDKADSLTKIQIFSEIKDNYNRKVEQEHCLDFMKRNWEHLIHLICDLRTGLLVFGALCIKENTNIWSTVAALKTTKVATRNKNVDETADLYPLQAESFKSELSDPIRVRLAEIILQKMEQ